ncbi:hypothetical protein [Nocardia sp. SYP-A9097]|uniref:hypothetical protein n=1 Tax=Nocardia sp. SYP-A9097 TaxID=2663237 RepID=UPI001891D0BA|nr:hypothetical protein [Nocardia sp. SYP-A9097]
MTTNSERPGGRSRLMLALVVIGVALVLAIAATTYFALNRNNGGAGESTHESVTLPPGTVTIHDFPGVSTTPEATTAQPTPAAPALTQQALWPFADTAAAAAWQQSYRDGGHQPWHLDSGAVALNFTQGYLGYTDIDKVVLNTTKGEESWVTVGFDNPNGVAVPAAVLHLVRLSAGDDAPWEIVGTDDRTLTLTMPQYGTKVNSPLAVGGHITGVDESLRVQVRQLDKEQPVGAIPGIPAGGENNPWSASVPFTATCPGTLTVAVATGGHSTAVERFAITGVHC